MSFPVMVYSPFQHAKLLSFHACTISNYSCFVCLNFALVFLDEESIKSESKYIMIKLFPASTLYLERTSSSLVTSILLMKLGSIFAKKSLFLLAPGFAGRNKLLSSHKISMGTGDKSGFPHLRVIVYGSLGILSVWFCCPSRLKVISKRASVQR